MDLFGKHLENINYVIENFYKEANNNLAANFTQKLGNLLNIQLTDNDVINWLRLNDIIFIISKPKQWTYYNKYNLLLNGVMELILLKDKISLQDIMNDISGTPDFTIKKEILLHKTNKIPNMYLYYYTKDYEKIEDLQQKFQFRYMYLLHYLNRKLREKGLNLLKNNYKLERIYQDIEVNKSNILNMEKIFDTVPKDLGYGASGIAYDVGKNKVLKLFSEKYIYDKALEAIERLHKNPIIADTEAMIYDTGYLGKFAGIDVYYYVMEKMTPVRNIVTPKNKKSISLILRAVISELKHLINFTFQIVFEDIKIKFNSENKNLLEINEEINKMVLILKRELLKDNFLVKDLFNLDKTYNLQKNWLDNFIKEVIMKYLTSRTDLHIGNLGLNNVQNLRYFDPTHPSWKEDINYILD